jgi:membrane fusion protein, multidrug efflux system
MSVLRSWIDAHRTLAWIGAGCAVAIAVIWMLRAGKIQPGLLARQHERISGLPVATVKAEVIPLAREFVGTIQSRSLVDAGSRVDATVREVRVRAGSRVRPGEVLVVLDSADLRAHLREAQGALAAAQADLARTAADHTRFKSLYEKGSVTAREYEAAEAGFNAARGRTNQARAAVAAAQAALEYGAVRSPVAGVVAERLVEPGDMALAGKPLVRLYDASALRVEVEVPELLARHVAIGSRIDVHVDAAGTEFKTAVNEIVPMADSASRSIVVRAPAPSDRGLKPGMFARASVEIGTERVITVPAAAVEDVGQLQTVRVLQDGAVRLRQVSLGPRLGDRFEVLAGLNPGERVLVRASATPQP